MVTPCAGLHIQTCVSVANNGLPNILEDYGGLVFVYISHYLSPDVLTCKAWKAAFKIHLLAFSWNHQFYIIYESNHEIKVRRGYQSERAKFATLCIHLLKEIDHSEDLIVDGRIILYLILKKWDGRVWPGFSWLKVVTGGRLFWTW
jgi:hypothetical protein